MAFAAARLFGRMQRNRGVRRAEAFALSRARRFATTAARRARGFVRKNPFTAGTFAGSAANDLLRGVKRYSRKGGLKGKRARRIGPAAKPPTTPSARIPAKYAVAAKMTKFKSGSTKKFKKAPKTVGAHFKDYGSFEADRCMYINHEHHGNTERFWFIICLALAKKVLAKARIYPGKSHSDPLIGPGTLIGPSGGLNPDGYQNVASDETVSKTYFPKLRLAYTQESSVLPDGASKNVQEYELIDPSKSPDQYKSLEAVAIEMAVAMQNIYINTSQPMFLESCQVSTGRNSVLLTPGLHQAFTMINLEDTEISLYVNCLLKIQNITPSDGSSADKNAIDVNPLSGKIYTSTGFTPTIDHDLRNSGEGTLSAYFNRMGDAHQEGRGITLLGGPGTNATPDAGDLGRIQHIPPARQLYDDAVSVKSANIHLAAGSMKYHKTTFTMKRTFRKLAEVMRYIAGEYGSGDAGVSGNHYRRSFGAHTLIGLTPAHRHGTDVIKVGINREVDMSAMIKEPPKVYPLKLQYTNDFGPIDNTNVATEHELPEI